MIDPKIIVKKCIDDNITIHPHCNSPYCSQKVLELNPAIGCEFQCQYCCLYTQEHENKFTTVTIYEDYPKMFNDFISENRETINNYTFFFSFESDCFQNALLSRGITQEILKILRRYNLKYFLLTKGGLPEQEVAELLINARDIGQVIVNDTMPNEEYRKILEPYTASNQDRYNLSKFCLDNNIQTSVSFSPIFPFGELDYLKEKVRKYTSLGINHFRLDMLELSVDSYKKLVELLPDHKTEFEKIYMDSDAIENNWKAPNANNSIKRYKPNKEYMANTYENIEMFIKSVNNKATVSICDAVIAGNELLSNFNKNALKNGYNCMGVKKI